MPVHLFDLANGRELGILSDDQFAFLADPQVLALLRTALAGRSEMDIRWQRDEGERTASDRALG
jgi:hypothetical protein